MPCRELFGAIGAIGSQKKSKGVKRINREPYEANRELLGSNKS
jgi:hypothetical protein